MGRVYQAGTLSGNPVAVAAAIETLDRLAADPPYARLAAMSERIERGVNAAAERHGVPLRVQRHATIFTPFATDTLPVTNLAESKRCDAALYGRFFHGMLDRGVYLEPSQFEVNFVSAAHTDADIDLFLQAADDTFATLG